VELILERTMNSLGYVEHTEPQHDEDRNRRIFGLLSAVACRTYSIRVNAPWQIRIAAFKYHSVFYRYFYILFCLLDVFSPFWDDVDCEFHEDCHTSGARSYIWLDSIILIVYAIDLTLDFAIFHPYYHFWKNKWIVLRLIGISCFFIEYIVIALGYRVSNFSRIFAALFLIERLRNCRKILGSMVRSVYGVLPIVCLFILLLIFYCLIGNIIFANDGGGEHGAVFNGPQDALMKLLFLLAGSVNFPDVMQQAFNRNAWVALYFVSFLVLGHFFLMNLLLAATYWHYTRLKRRNHFSRLQKGIKAAEHLFDLMIQQRSNISAVATELPMSPIRKAKNPESHGQMQQRITCEEWFMLVNDTFGISARWRVRDSAGVMSRMQANPNELARTLYTLAAPKEEQTIDRRAFVWLVLLLRCNLVPFELSATASARARNRTLASASATKQLQIRCEGLLRDLLHTCDKWFAIEVLVVINIVILMAGQLKFHADLMDNVLSPLLLIIFVFELGARCVVHGVRGYWRSGLLQKIDIITILISLAGEVGARFAFDL